MDTLSTSKLNIKEEKNPVSKQPILIAIIRKVFSIVGRILAKILKIFLFLLFIRKPVILLTKFMTIASFIFLLLIFVGYMLGSTPPIPPEESETAIVIGSIIIFFLSVAARWGYDTLLLRLAPPDNDLMLFQ